MEEIFMDIPGYEGLYQISNYGRIKNISPRYITIEYLKPIADKYGYFHVCLYKNKQKKYLKIHRLVAQVFIPNPNNLTQVNHKDENKHNNFVYINPDGSVDTDKSNLEWCTPQYNNNYGTRIERITRQKKKKIQKISNGTILKEYTSLTEAAEDNHCSISYISLVLNGKRKNHNNCEWMFVKRG